jgi:hypothetical protein
MASQRPKYKCKERAGAGAPLLRTERQHQHLAHVAHDLAALAFGTKPPGFRLSAFDFWEFYLMLMFCLLQFAVSLSLFFAFAFPLTV